jgi:hypothetical protein
MPTTVLASRYNTLRDNVNLVLGPSTPAALTYGYGQAFSTNSVIGTRTVANPVNADKVSAQDYEDLYIDLIRTRAHQIGSSVAIDEFVIGDYETNTGIADNYLLEWIASYTYTNGVVVYYNTYAYECIEEHTSTSVFDPSKWSIISFNLNDTVHYNNSLYRCIQSYTSTGSFDLTKWNLVVDKIEEAYILGLESLATNIIADRFTVAPDNLRLTSTLSASSTRPSTNSWNGTISHIFTMTFANDTARRHFFNAGGQIRISASVNYTGSQAKTVDWQSILNAMGTISFKGFETVNNAGVGSGSGVGNYTLTGSYQLIYSRSGGAVYARNRYNIYAANSATLDGTSAIIFKVEFVDGQPNDLTWGIDEVVLGTFNSNVQTATPDGEININGTVYPTVFIETDPTGSIVRNLS